MIFGFVYLDKSTLAGYAAQVDGGLIAETKTRRSKKATGGASAGFKWLGLKAEGGGENEQSQTFSDAPEAQFQRLLAAANRDPDAIGWIEVLEPDTNFDSAQVGEIVAWECDLDIPEILRLVTRGGAGTKLLGLWDKMVAATLAASGTDGAVLTPEQRAEIAKYQLLSTVGQQLLTDANIPRVVVGTDSATRWTVFGTLIEQHLIADDIEGERLLVVGRLKRKLTEDESRRIVNFPDPSKFNTNPNATPPSFSDDQFVKGPAIELDILAIYR